MAFCFESNLPDRDRTFQRGFGLCELEHYRLDKDKENIGFVGNARRQRVDKVFPEPDTYVDKRAVSLLNGFCSYIPGPVNGNLYAQVDKSLKDRIRSHSLDSGINTQPVQRNKNGKGETATLGRTNQCKEQISNNSCSGYQFHQFNYPASKMSVSSQGIRSENRTRVPDMDDLLYQLSACTEILDTAVNQHRAGLQKRNQNIDRYQNGPLEPQVSVNDRIKGYSKNNPLPAAPTRQAASFDATSRYQGGTHSLPPAMIRTRTPGLEQRATIGRVPGPDNYLSSPLLTSTPAPVNNHAPLDGQLCTASEVQTTPPISPVNPKYFATQIVPAVQRAPAEIVSSQYSVVVNGSRTLHEGSGNRPQAVCNGEGVRGNIRVNEPVSLRLENKHETNEMRPSDLNNNEKLNGVSRNGFDDFSDGRRKSLDEEETLPEKGIVATNVALLSDLFSPTRVQEIRHPPRKGTVPMPGLTTKTAEEVSKEISEYNAKALAPGELSHASGTLYFTGLPPKRVVERGEHERIEVQLEILPRGITVEASHVNQHNHEHEGLSDHSPMGSLDGMSVDEGVESKGDTDELATLGPSPTASTSSHADSAFGDWASFSLSSALSTPVTRYSPYRLNQTAQESRHEMDSQVAQAGSSPHSSISSLLEGAVDGRGGGEAEPDDEESGYARLEDIKTAKHAARNAQLASLASKSGDETSASAISPTSQKSSLSEQEAVDEIVTEVASTHEQAMDPLEQAPSGAGTPYSNKSRSRSGSATPTSPINSSFDTALGRERKKLAHQSDKGYGSTASVSSNTSSSSDVFLESPRVPGVKFDKDTSALWYKPNISREQTIEILKDKEPGSFIVRDSHSFKGFFGLALKVAVPPASVLQGDISNVDMTNELVRHFLIESTKKGVRLRGKENEPIFGSLSAFVYQHSITPLSLPLRLVLPTEDSLDDLFDYPDNPVTPTQKYAHGAVYNLMFMGQSSVELLTGPSAIERSVENLRTVRELPALAPITFKINPQGITLTDNDRKAFFRRHFDLKAVQYCGIDPLDKRWDLKVPAFNGQSRCFGLVVRKPGEHHNECHLFAEIEEETPITIVINAVNRYMSVPP